MLAKRFEHILHDLGMAGLEHPLFYHAPVGIRFKIGGEEPIYLDRRAAKLKTNPAYVQGALDRAAAIYRALPAVPDLLRIDGYPDEEPAESLLTVIRQRVGLPVPDEQLSATEQDEDGDTHAQVQFYWNLSKISFQPEPLKLPRTGICPPRRCKAGLIRCAPIWNWCRAMLLCCMK